MGRRFKSEKGKEADQQFKEEYGQKLREIREAKGLSAISVADLAGVTRQFIYMVETGKARPSEELQDRFSQLLGDTRLHSSARRKKRNFDQLARAFRITRRLSKKYLGVPGEKYLPGTVIYAGESALLFVDTDVSEKAMHELQDIGRQIERLLTEDVKD